MSSAQLASAKPTQSIDPFLVSCNLKLMQPAIYQRICLTAFQCCSVGLVVNLATVLTAKGISGLVQVDK